MIEEKNNQQQKSRKDKLLGMIALLGVFGVSIVLPVYYYNTAFVDEQLIRLENSNTCYELLIGNLRGEAFLSNGLSYMLMTEENQKKILDIVQVKGKGLCKYLYELIEKTNFISDKEIHFDWLTCEELIQMKYEFPVRYHKDIDDAYYSSKCGRNIG